MARTSHAQHVVNLWNQGTVGSPAFPVLAEIKEVSQVSILHQVFFGLIFGIYFLQTYNLLQILIAESQIPGALLDGAQLPFF